MATKESRGSSKPKSPAEGRSPGKHRSPSPGASASKPKSSNGHKSGGKHASASKGSAKSRRLREQRRKQRMRRRLILTGALLLCCALVVALVVFLSHRSGDSDLQRTAQLELEEGVELEPSASEEASAEPSPSATPTPTPTPTFTPTPTPEPTPEPTPTPVPEPVTITITATGDVTLSSYKTRYGTISNFEKAVEEKGYEYFLENFADYFAQDDLTIVNLEGPLTESDTKRAGRVFNFRGKPEYVNILTSASIEVASLANNHSLDYGKQGFQDTMDVLKEAGIGASGYGVEYFTEVKGITVGFVGFTEWNFKKNAILKAVAAAREKCDLLIVSMHWGSEGYDTFTSYSLNMGPKLVDAGADLVIGNHPHVPGAIRKYKGKYIIHTLGNFLFGGNDEPGRKVRRCAVFRQKFIVQPGGAVEDGGIDIVPGWISGTIKYNDFHPLVANKEDGTGILNDMRKATRSNMDWSEVVWLDDSYVYQQGILRNPNQQAASATAAPQGADPNAAAQGTDANAPPQGADPNAAA